MLYRLLGTLAERFGRYSSQGCGSMSAGGLGWASACTERARACVDGLAARWVRDGSCCMTQRWAEARRTVSWLAQHAFEYITWLLRTLARGSTDDDASASHPRLTRTIL